MEDSDPIRTEWFNWIKSVVGTGWTLVWADSLSDSDGPRPTGPYITLKIIAGPQPTGQSELRKNATTGRFDLCNIGVYTLSIQSFRAGAWAVLRDLQNKMHSPLTTETFRTGVANIAIEERGGITDVSALLEAGYERRYAMDVIFTAPENVDSGIGPIEKVTIKGKLKDARTGTRDVPEFTVEKP